MTKSPLETWLDVTLGELPQEGRDELGCLKPILGLSTGSDAGHRALQDRPDIRDCQDVLLDQDVQKTRNDCATGDG